MDVTVSAILMIEQDRQISDVMAKERPRLRNFIRRRYRVSTQVHRHHPIG